MVQLIGKFSLPCLYSYTLFQFYYGSINSLASSFYIQSILYFNSTMVQLIEGRFVKQNKKINNFNSTMVQLIVGFKFHSETPGEGFQFYYGSINSWNLF